MIETPKRATGLQIIPTDEENLDDDLHNHRMQQIPIHLSSHLSNLSTNNFSHNPHHMMQHSNIDTSFLIQHQQHQHQQHQQQQQQQQQHENMLLEDNHVSAVSLVSSPSSLKTNSSMTPPHHLHMHQDKISDDIHGNDDHGYG
jgi:hypothetical protein